MASRRTRMSERFLQICRCPLDTPGYFSHAFFHLFQGQLISYDMVNQRLESAAVGLMSSSFVCVLWLVNFLVSLDHNFDEEADQECMTYLEDTLNCRFALH